MSFPQLPLADFQPCWDCLCSLAKNKQALLVSKCLLTRVIHEEEDLRSSGLVPFNNMMIATYQEFATIFKQALKCYYNALKKRPEERNFVHLSKDNSACDICKGVPYSSADGTMYTNCTVVKVYFTLQENGEGEDSIKYLLDKIEHKECGQRLICEFYINPMGKLLQVLLCYALED